MATEQTPWTHTHNKVGERMGRSQKGWENHVGNPAEEGKKDAKSDKETQSITHRQQIPILRSHQTHKGDERSTKEVART
eukprot:6646610-Pyramimonas_sp.AAC.1